MAKQSREELRRVLGRLYPAMVPIDSGGEESDSPRPLESTYLLRNAEEPSLFRYQKELASAAAATLADGGQGLVALPTGAGKTRTAVFAALDVLANGQLDRLIWLAPSVELVDQAQETFQRMWREFGRAPDLALSRDAEHFALHDRAVLLTTPQAVYAGLQRRGGNVPPVDGVIFDEAHQLGARTFRAAVEALTSTQVGVGVVGLSATPGRMAERETEDLVRLFGGNLIVSGELAPNPVLTLQKRGILSQLKFRTIPRPEPEDEGARLLVAAELLVKLSSRGRRILVFTESVAGAEVLAEALVSAGVAAESVQSRTPPVQRASTLERFAAGEVAVVTNQRLLATGYDCPAVSDVLLCARIGSPILFEQMVGRAARGPRTGGSRVARIWQFDDHLELHGLPTSYYRYRQFDWGD